MKTNVSTMHTRSNRSPVVQYASHSRRFAGWRSTSIAYALHRRAGLADALDDLRLGERGIVEGDRHHAAEERRPRPPDAFDLLRLALQLLLRRA